MSSRFDLCRFYLFRHGETDWNAEGRFQGHIDVPLNERGREQARGLIPKLRDSKLGAIVSSDLKRARETAKIVGDAIGVEVYQDPQLREAHLGQAQGLTYQEIEGRYGAIMPRWRSNHPTDADVSYPGGEKGSEVLRRALDAMILAAKTHQTGHIGISTHGGVIRRIMGWILSESEDPQATLEVPIPNAVLYVVQYEAAQDRWTVVEGPG